MLLFQLYPLPLSQCEHRWVFISAATYLLARYIVQRAAVVGFSLCHPSVLVAEAARDRSIGFQLDWRAGDETVLSAVFAGVLPALLWVSDVDTLMSASATGSAATTATTAICCAALVILIDIVTALAPAITRPSATPTGIYSIPTLLHLMLQLVALFLLTHLLMGFALVQVALVCEVAKRWSR